MRRTVRIKAGGIAKLTTNCKKQGTCKAHARLEGPNSRCNVKMVQNMFLTILAQPACWPENDWELRGRRMLKSNKHDQRTFQALMAVDSDVFPI